MLEDSHQDRSQVDHEIPAYKGKYLSKYSKVKEKVTATGNNIEKILEYISFK